MRGAVPPLPNMPSWRGVQLGHRDKCTVLLPSLILKITSFKGLT
jgi:hypothetical protein